MEPFILLIKYYQSFQHNLLSSVIFCNSFNVIILKLKLKRYQQQKLLKMEKLLMSRRQKQENQQRLLNLSPQKYGKGAYAELTFTPSKLADNVLFREASNLKRVEGETSKNRQYSAQNQILNDQVVYLKKERDGISQSLNQIISMYKSILAEMQAKNEERIKEIQKKFKEEMQKCILDKEEEAKYFQSEKQILQETIQQLQKQIVNIKEQMLVLKSQRDNVCRDVDLANSEKKRVEERLAHVEQKSKQEIHSLKENNDILKKEYMHAEVEWKNQMNEQKHKKDKEIENIERTHRVELEKVEAQRNNQVILKNQELNQLTKAFEAESNRLNDILINKDRVIDQLSIENNKQKTRVLNLTRDYEAEINMLTHQKNRLADEVEHLGKQNELLAKDKVLITGDLQEENRNLRDLLLESSMQLQKCKNELLDLAKENTTLLSRLKSVEEEARTWRQSYYINKSRPY